MTDFNPLDDSRLGALREEFDARPQNRLSMNAVTSSGISKVAHN